MNRNTNKSIINMLLISVMALTMSACGGGGVEVVVEQLRYQVLAL